MDTLNNSELMESLLDSDINDRTTSGVIAAGKVLKDNYRELVKFKNVRSYSMEQVLKQCARKYQIMKHTANLEEEQERETNEDFAFGHSVGAGVAVYDECQDLKKAIWAAFLAWNIDLLAVKEKRPNRPDPRKSFSHAVWALYVYEVFYQEELGIADYDVVQLEATIAVDLENGDYYVGHIDELLKSRDTNHYKVKENKTTVFNSIDPAMYGNSDQALSYALVIDAHGSSEYDVLYCIYSSTEQRWIKMEFTKTAQQKAEWLQMELLLSSQIEMYSELNFFPTNGASCMAFNRTCPQFGSCTYSPIKVYGKRFDDLPELTGLEELNEMVKLDYRFTFSDLVKRQQEKINEI